MRENEQIRVQVGGGDEIPEIEVDLVELCLRLVEKWKKIVLGALVGALIMGIYSFAIAKPVYEATSKLYVMSSRDSAINLSDLQIGAYLTSDYTEVFKTWEVHEIVRQNLQLDYSREELSGMLTISKANVDNVATVRLNQKFMCFSFLIHAVVVRSTQTNPSETPPFLPKMTNRTCRGDKRRLTGAVFFIFTRPAALIYDSRAILIQQYQFTTLWMRCQGTLPFINYHKFVTKVDRGCKGGILILDN